MNEGPRDPAESAQTAETTETAETVDRAGVGSRRSAPAGSRQRVVLLTGPSGAGKSRLAARLASRTGWPVVRLDDFYREIDDPRLPRSGLGIPDWDHPQSWNTDAALQALRALIETGEVEVPVYDIATSQVTGRRRLTARPGDHVLAEGLFAGRLASPLQAEGLLTDALCVRQNRYVTAVRRFVRDLVEHRKPPRILMRRGWSLLREEPGVVAAASAQGARPTTPREAERDLAPLLAASGC
ncbi:MAG: uridine kinase [Humibacillus sp.]|nr:uridine kinase [Humibacillus sp.]MDN5778789.1 uridine kinase [Humibacillus sp.]